MICGGRFLQTIKPDHWTLVYPVFGNPVFSFSKLG